MARILPGVGNLYKEARTATGAPTVFDERKPYINETRKAIERAWAQPEVVGKMLDIAAGTGKTFYDKYNRVQEAKAQVIAQRRKTGQTQKPDPTGMFSLGGVTPQELEAAGVNTMQQAAADAAGARTYGEREAAMRMAERAYDRPGSYSFMDQVTGGPDTRRRELIKKLYPPLQKATGGGRGRDRRYDLQPLTKFGNLTLEDFSKNRAELQAKVDFARNPSMSKNAMLLTYEMNPDAFDNAGITAEQVWVYATPQEQEDFIKLADQDYRQVTGKAELLLRRNQQIAGSAPQLAKELESANSIQNFYAANLEPFEISGALYGPRGQAIQELAMMAQSLMAEAQERGVRVEDLPRYRAFEALKSQVVPLMGQFAGPPRGSPPNLQKSSERLKGQLEGKSKKEEPKKEPEEEPELTDEDIDRIYSPDDSRKKQRKRRKGQRKQSAAGGKTNQRVPTTGSPIDQQADYALRNLKF